MLRLILACLIVTAAPAVTQVAEPLSAEDFAAESIMGAMRLSPGGSRISYLQEIGEDNFVVIATPDDPYTPIRRIKLGEFGLASVRWASENRILLRLKRYQISFALLAVVPVTRLMVVEVDSGEARLVDTDSNGYTGGEILYVEPHGRWAMISSQDRVTDYPSVKRVDLATGEAVQVQKEMRDVWHWIVDSDGMVRGGVSHEGRKWAIYYRDRAGEKLRKIKGKFDKDEFELVESYFLSPLKDRSMIVSNHGNGRFALYQLDVENVEPGELIFANPDGDIDEVLTDYHSGELIGVRYHAGRWHTEWFDEEFKALQARLDKALPGNDNELLSWSRDRSRILIHSRRPDDPGAYYVFDRAARELKIVGNPNPSLPETGLSPVTFHRYEARDGLSIPAYLALPPGKEDAKGLPLIVMPHGGPFARDTWDYHPIVQFLASRGYAVLQPQFRGTTGMGLHFVEAGYGQWGYKMQDDVDDGVDWLVNQGIADPERVCIAGISYGGYAALWGAIRNPERYRCAISMAGISDVRAMLKYDKGAFAAKRYYRSWETKVAGLDNDKDSLRAISPLYHLDRLKIPLLIGHGQKDKNVPPSQSQELIDELTKRGVEVDHVFYENSVHGPTNAEDLADWLKRMEAFLAKHNPAD